MCDHYEKNHNEVMSTLCTTVRSWDSEL